MGNVEVGFAVMGSDSVNIFAPSIEGFGTAVGKGPQQPDFCAKSRFRSAQTLGVWVAVGAIGMMAPTETVGPTPMDSAVIPHNKCNTYIGLYVYSNMTV